MRVIVITHNYIRRQGDLTALYLHRLSSGLVKKGMRITVVCPHAPGLLKNDEIDGVHIHRFPYPFSNRRPLAYTGNMHEDVARSVMAKGVFLGFLRSFYKHALGICRSEQADVIWANWWIPPGLVAARIAGKLRIPLIISSHGTDISLLGKQGIVRTLSRYVYRRTTQATVVSSFLKKKLLKNVDALNPEQVSILPMPVGMEHFPKTDFLPKEKPLFLSVARYTKQKRLEDIVNAAEILHLQGIDFRVKMVGEGPMEDSLRQLVADKGMTEIFDIGPLVAQQKLGELYRQCDAVLLVSEGEGFGLVLVEAGLTGRPVIGARSGGITDVIEHGENGLLIDVGDVFALAENMKAIITDPDMKKRLGDGGYRIAMESFSTPILVDRMYNLLLNSKKRQTGI